MNRYKFVGFSAGVLITVTLLLASCSAGNPTPSPVTAPMPEAPEPGSAGAEAAQQAAKALAAQDNLDILDVAVRSVEAVQWPDSCLGIHVPGQMCAMHVVDGYKVMLEAQDHLYEYRTNGDGSMAVPALALSWHREGGLAGFCEDLVIDQMGDVQTMSCKSGAPQNTGQMRLNDGQLQQLESWLSRLGPFQIDQADNATADALTVKLSFGGLGTQPATETDQQEIVAFAATVYPQVSGDQASGAMSEPDQVVKDFLATRQIEPSGASSLDFLSRSLQAVIESGQTLTDVLGLDIPYKSFGIAGSQVEDGGQRALVEANLNAVSPIARAFELVKEGGLWRINTVIVYALPAMSLPANVVDADQTLLDYVWGLQDKQPAAAWALLTPEAQAQTSETALAQSAAASKQIAAPLLRLIQASADRLVYAATLWVQPTPGASAGWVDGSNARWFVLSSTADGWRIAQITDSPIS
jgi:hypothetical protein